MAVQISFNADASALVNDRSIALLYGRSYKAGTQAVIRPAKFVQKGGNHEDQVVSIQVADGLATVTVNDDKIASLGLTDILVAGNYVLTSISSRNYRLVPVGEGVTEGTLATVSLVPDVETVVTVEAEAAEVAAEVAEVVAEATAEVADTVELVEEVLAEA